jgi:hypothetical protein
MKMTEEVKLEKTAIKGRFFQDVLTIESLESNLFDGKIASHGTVNLPPQGGPQVNVSLQANQLDLTKALNATSQKKDLAVGKVDFQVQVTGTPRPDPAGAKSLFPRWIQSEGNLAIGPGKLSNFNLLGDTLKALVDYSPITPEAKKLLSQVDWRSVTSTFQTQEGALFLKPFKMDYGSAQAEASGRIEPDSKVNFSGVLTLSQKVVGSLGGAYTYLANSKGNLDIPFRVTGELGLPVTYIDMKTIGKKVVQKQAQEVKKVVTNEVKGIVGDFLKPLPTPKK